MGKKAEAEVKKLFNALKNKNFKEFGNRLVSIKGLNNADLEPLLSVRLDDRQSLLHIVAHDQDYFTLRFLMNKLDDEQLLEQVRATTDNDWNLLHFAACYQDSNTFQILIERVSNSDLFELSKAMTKDDQSLVHMAARYQHQNSKTFRNENSKAFLALINRFTAPELLELSRVNNLLHIVAHYQDSDTFRALIERVSDSDLLSLSKAMTDDGQSLVHIAARYQNQNVFPNQNSEAFLALIRRLPDAALLELSRKEPLLHTVAKYQTSEVFLALIERVIDKVEDDAERFELLKATDDGQSLVHIAARYQNSKAFLALIARVPDSVLLDLPGMKCLLHFVGCCQTSDAFLTLINKITDEDKLVCLLGEKSENEWSVFQEVAFYQNATSFSTLLKSIADSARVAQLPINMDKLDWKPENMKIYFLFMSEEDGRALADTNSSAYRFCLKYKTEFCEFLIDTAETGNRGDARLAKKAILLALKKDTSLNKLFSEQRGRYGQAMRLLGSECKSHSIKALEKAQKSFESVSVEMEMNPVSQRSNAS